MEENNQINQKVDTKAKRTRESYRLKDEKYKDIQIDYKGNSFKVPAKLDVITDNMDDKTKGMLYDVYLATNGQENLPFELILTSGEEGKHSEGSRHYKGLAIDVRISPEFRDNPTQDPAFQYFWKGDGANIRKKHSFQLIDPNHGSAPHIHMEYETKQGLDPIFKDNNIGNQTQQSTNTSQNANYNGEWYDSSRLPDISNSLVFVSEVETDPKKLEEQAKQKAKLAKQKLQEEEYRRKALYSVIQGMQPIEVPQPYQQQGMPQLVNPSVGQSSLSLPNISSLPDPLQGFK